MDILEEYKKLAERRRQDLEQTGEDTSGVHVLRSLNVVSDLQTIHNYLHDLVEQMNYVKSDTRTSILIEGLGKLEDLKQQGYYLH